MAVKDLKTSPDLTPKRDDTFIKLIQGAVKGEVPVYLASVPLGFCVPFDLDYRPDLHPMGAAAIRSIIRDPKLSAAMIAYPRGKWFVISDDYIRLFAALRRPVDSIMCWVLGESDNDLVRVLQGPLALVDVPRTLGLR